MDQHSLKQLEILVNLFLTGNKSEIQLFNFCAISVTHNVAVVIDNSFLGIEEALTSSSTRSDR